MSMFSFVFPFSVFCSSPLPCCLSVGNRWLMFDSCERKSLRVNVYSDFWFFFSFTEVAKLVSFWDSSVIICCVLLARHGSFWIVATFLSQQIFVLQTLCWKLHFLGEAEALLWIQTRMSHIASMCCLCCRWATGIIFILKLQSKSIPSVSFQIFATSAEDWYESYWSFGWTAAGSLARSTREKALTFFWSGSFYSCRTPWGNNFNYSWANM